MCDYNINPWYLCKLGSLQTGVSVRLPDSIAIMIVLLSAHLAMQCEQCWGPCCPQKIVQSMVSGFAPPLRERRKISRLQALFKIIHQDYSLSIPPHFISMTRSTRLYHPHRFILPNSSTYSYQQSFFSRSIKDWNNLPSSIIESNNIDSFSAELQTLYRTQ